MLIYIKIVGLILILLSLIHIIFPKYFHWKTELNTLSLINQQIMKVHTFFIALTVFLMGTFCMSVTNDIIETPLGKKISLGLAIFWIIRLIFQFFVYSKKLWKGKLFETTIHILFSLLWLFISAVFVIAFLY